MMLLSILFFINMPFSKVFFFLGKQLWDKWTLERNKVECERERECSFREGDDEGGSVRSICIVLYT